MFIITCVCYIFKVHPNNFSSSRFKINTVKDKDVIEMFHFLNRTDTLSWRIFLLHTNALASSIIITSKSDLHHYYSF